MTKKHDLVENRKLENSRQFGRFAITRQNGNPLFDIWQGPPRNEEEAIQHGNALAATGNYPIGTNGCFNVGISGGCGPDCYVYKEGNCENADEILESIKINPVA